MTPGVPEPAALDIVDNPHPPLRRGRVVRRVRRAAPATRARNPPCRKVVPVARVLLVAVGVQMHADLARRRRAGVTRRRAVRLVVACSTAALARCGHLQGGPTRLVGVTLLEREHRGLLFRGLLRLLRVAAQRDRLVPRRAVKVDDEDIGLVAQPAPPRRTAGLRS